MLSSTIATLVGLCLVAQAPPPSGAAGSTTAAGVTSGGSARGASTKKSGHDLADLLLPLADSQRRSGTVGPLSPPSGANVRVSTTNSGDQFRPTLAVDPTDRRHLIAAAIDRQDGIASAAFYASFDGGATWSESLVADRTEPSVAFGPDGEVYLSAVGESSGKFYVVSNVYAGRSYDGGRTTTAWDAVTHSAEDVLAVAPKIVVDPSDGPRRGTAYIAFSQFDLQDPTASYVNVAASSNGGTSWTIATASPSLLRSDVSAAVDSQGILGVAFATVFAGIFFVASSDGGATFGSALTISIDGAYTIPGVPSTFASAPSLAVDRSGGPFRDAFYLAIPVDAAGGPDVLFSRSYDHGTTWSAPIAASDVTTNSQYAAAVGVDPQGNVDVTFFDCRDDPNNRRVNRYLARSSDGGSTFRPNIKLSDVDFDPSSLDDPEFLPRGSDVAASDRLVHAIWSDGRNGDLDVYTSSANLALFTDVATISAAAGGTATFTVAPGPLFQSAEYHLLGSLSGTTPGTDFFFENVPLNYDLFMLATIYDANSNVFPGFTGILDATGAATAQLVSGPLPPALIGIQMDFAVMVRVANAVRWSSDATSVVIGN